MKNPEDPKGVREREIKRENRGRKEQWRRQWGKYG